MAAHPETKCPQHRNDQKAFRRAHAGHKQRARPLASVSATGWTAWAVSQSSLAPSLSYETIEICWGRHTNYRRVMSKGTNSSRALNAFGPPRIVSARNSLGTPYMPNRNLVLVVDDDPGMLSCVERVLRQHAYEPILFSSAEAFNNHTDFEKAVCVILDINLNDGSGIELRHGLTNAGVSVPVIYMTADENAAVRKAALNSGCIAFLTKPFSVQSLIEPLNKASSGRS